MYSEDDLDAAVAGGALDREAADRFRSFMARSRRTALVDEEQFRLITGFNDVFVVIASALLLGALAWLGAQMPLGGREAYPLGAALVAAASWGLAEVFTARRRMALPSILLLAAFVGGVYAAAAGLLGTLDPTPGPALASRAGALNFAGASAVAAVGAYAHWRRFHVPITVAAGVLTLVALALSLLKAASFAAAAHLSVAIFVSGLCVFALAMRWDGADPRRETHRADVAFWLHLLAAPLIVHPAVAILGLMRAHVEPASVAAVLLLYLLLGVVALAIDRRALMVSALAYVLYDVSALFRQWGALNFSTALTAFVLGAALLLLSAYWPRARAAVLPIFPERVRARLPVAPRSEARIRQA